MTNKKLNLIVIVVLFLLTIALRLVPIFPSYFPFMYDHAKDSLIIMQMGLAHKPSLIGAVTSIPGVYYGPLWYYLALPLNLLLGFNPLASTLTVILLAAISTYVMYRYVGTFAAIWYAVSFGLITTQNSAWSPYLTPLVVLPALLILLQLKTKKPISTQQLALLALFTSLGFHFQPAFAIVFLPLVLMCLVVIKPKMSWKQIIIAVGIFLIPFAPHVLFELRHDFHQTKQMLHFFTHYSEQANVVQPNRKGWGRLIEIGQYELASLGLAVSPIEVPFFWAGVLLVAALVWMSIKKKRNHFWRDNRVFIIFVIGTYLFYLVLPAKPYYFVGLLPVWVVWISTATKKYLGIWWKPLAFILVWMALQQGYRNYQQYHLLAQTDQVMLQPKINAIHKIYDLSNGGPFKVYTFVPEIYDYTYQALFRKTILNGQRPPVEFSYAPGETAYMEQVAPDLLTDQFKDQKYLLSLPDQPIIFLIIEKPVYDWAYDEWWHRVAAPLDIVGKYPINEAITVYEARQKTPQTTEVH